MDYHKKFPTRQKKTSDTYSLQTILYHLKKTPNCIPIYYRFKKTPVLSLSDWIEHIIKYLPSHVLEKNERSSLSLLKYTIKCLNSSKYVDSPKKIVILMDYILKILDIT